MMKYFMFTLGFSLIISTPLIKADSYIYGNDNLLSTNQKNNEITINGNNSIEEIRTGNTYTVINNENGNIIIYTYPTPSKDNYEHNRPNINQRRPKPVTGNAISRAVVIGVVSSND